MLDQRPYIRVMTTVFHAKQYGRFIGKNNNHRVKTLHRANQSINFFWEDWKTKVLFIKKQFNRLKNQFDRVSSVTTTNKAYRFPVWMVFLIALSSRYQETSIKYITSTKNSRFNVSKPVLYYRNSTSTKRLWLSGDIELNPGPSSTTSKVKKPVMNAQIKNHQAPVCDKYKKTIRNNSIKVLYIHCKNSIHLKRNTLKNNV